MSEKKKIEIMNNRCDGYENFQALAKDFDVTPEELQAIEITENNYKQDCDLADRTSGGSRSRRSRRGRSA